MTTLALCLLVVCATMLAWTYLLYPALVLRLGARARRDTIGAAVPLARDGAAEAPRLAVVIAAFNESAHIGARIRNLLQQDYPPERVTIWIGSDGSDDDTAAQARSVAAQVGPGRVRVLEFTSNRGKASVLNDLCAQADSDLLVFSDANTDFAPDTLRHLAAAFADPRVGAVCGELLLQPRAGDGSQDHAYWSFERRLKAAEAAIGGLLGANGAVYAIRRALYRPLEPDMICDDLVIAMQVAADGWKNRYVPAARAYEEPPADEASEFHRRVRIGIGNYQALFRRPEYLLHAPWVLRFTYVSHKVLRWLTPLWLAGLLAACAVLRGVPPFGLLCAAQLGGWLLAALVYATRRAWPWPRVIRGGMLFALLNAAFVVAFVRYVRGDYRGSWRRTVRA